MLLPQMRQRMRLSRPIPGLCRIGRSSSCSAAPGSYFVAAGVAVTIENVTEGLLEATTLKSALVSKMLAVTRTRNTTRAAHNCAIGRANAFPSFE